MPGGLASLAASAASNVAIAFYFWRQRHPDLGAPSVSPSGCIPWQPLEYRSISPWTPIRKPAAITAAHRLALNVGYHNEHQ